MNEPPLPLLERVRSCIFPMQTSASEGGFSIRLKENTKMDRTLWKHLVHVPFKK